ncbi:hypothetical protein L7F22_013209 [Adiantum nelumboides]|nr:hypothetical protein [Adiantum nelumboides]
MAMHRRPRSRHPRVQQKGDSSLACAAWASSGPNSRNENISYILSCKISSEAASASSLELTRYNFKEGLLSEAIQRIAEDDLPESIAVHPGGDVAICSFSRSCKIYELEKKEEHSQLKASGQDRVSLEGIGVQVALAFSADGSRLAAAGKDGYLRVFEWPSLNLLFLQIDGSRPLSSIDISLDGAFLAATPANGIYCRVWDIEKSTIVTTIQNSNKTELFGLCRFSRDGTKPFLFLTMSKGGVGAIGVWVMDTWNKVGIKIFSKDPITSFATSHDGKSLAIGNAAGLVNVIEVKKMQIVQSLKDAHTSEVTFLGFSPNGRAFLSFSSDFTTRVTKLNLAKEWKEWQIYALLLSLILASAVLFYIFFEHSDSFWNFPLGRDQPARPLPEAIYGSMPDFDGGEFM